jgi:hypothetical protein
MTVPREISMALDSLGSAGNTSDPGARDTRDCSHTTGGWGHFWRARWGHSTLTFLVPAGDTSTETYYNPWPTPTAAAVWGRLAR